MKLLLLLGILIISAVIMMINNKSISSDYDFKIYFFNAGKADAIILSKNNHYIMIDTGEESLSSEILAYLENNNITKLDYLIITHFDKDHVGSAANIINNIEVGSVLQSNVEKESEYYNNYLKAIAEKNIEVMTVTEDYDLKLDNIDIIVKGTDYVYSKNESNNSSLIVSVIYKDNKFLFMGDSQNARIKDFISTNNETYDFIKVPYHGFYLKRLDSLLNNTGVEYGVITCSKSEGCEDETLEVLKNNNVKYYMTKNGSISVYSNGSQIIIKQ